MERRGVLSRGYMFEVCWERNGKLELKNIPPTKSEKLQKAKLLSKKYVLEFFACIRQGTRSSLYTYQNLKSMRNV